MTNSINVDSYVDLLIQCNEEYEPFGTAALPAMVSEDDDYISSQLALYAEDVEQWHYEY